MKIAVFDSGVGGLTVLADARRLLPGHDYLYYADTAHVPYGDKGKDEVRRLVLEAAGQLAGLGMQALLVACNTATAVAIEELRRRFALPVVGMEPAVKPAVSRRPGRRVLVAATPLTLREEKFNRLVEAVDGEGVVDRLPLPELVDFAEKGRFNARAVAACLRRATAGLALEEYGTLVLGCTHFLYFLPHFRRFFPGLDIVDGNRGTVRQLARQIAALPGARNGGGSGTVAFFESGRRVADSTRFERFLARYADCRPG